MEANVTIEPTQKGDFNVEGDASFNNDLHVHGNTIINDLSGNILTANKGIYSVIDSSNANITDISSIEILSSNITINNDLIVHQDASINIIIKTQLLMILMLNTFQRMLLMEMIL